MFRALYFLSSLLYMTAAFSLPKISLFHSLPGLPHEIDKGSLLYYPSILPRTQSLFSHSQHTQLAYIDALDLYHSLESRSSCHREATSSIMLDCSALGYEDINEDIKINYAVKLAICELRGTGIVYPKECDNLPTHTENGSATERKRTMRCIKRLEERPQYWTTLSNNIQNAMLLCNAARQGMEKDNLLSLHKNITKAQLSLYLALETSLNEVWRATKAQRGWSDEWKNSHEELVGTVTSFTDSLNQGLKEAKENTIQSINELMKPVHVLQTNIFDFTAGIIKALESANLQALTLNRNFEAFISQSEEAAGLAIHKREEGIHSSLANAQELQKVLISITDISVTKLFGSIETMREQSQDSIEYVKQLNLISSSMSQDFSGIAESYRNLGVAHSELRESINIHGENLEQLFVSLGQAAGSASAHVDKIVKGMEDIRLNMDQVAEKIQTLNIIGYFKKVMVGGLIIFAFLISSGAAGTSTGLRFFASLLGLCVGASLIYMRGKNLNFYTSTVDVDLQHTRRTQEVWEMDSAVSEYLAEDLADSPDQSANGIISTILTGTLLCLVLALLVLVRLFLVRNIFDMEAAIRPRPLKPRSIPVKNVSTPVPVFTSTGRRVAPGWTKTKISGSRMI